MGSRVDAIRELFRVYDSEGVAAMLALMPDDMVWRPLLAERDLTGEEFREHLEAEVRHGGAREYQALEFEEIDGCVLVSGTVQVRSRDLHVDVQPCWLYRYDGDRLVSMTGYPTRSAALRAIAEGTDG